MRFLRLFVLLSFSFFLVSCAFLNKTPRQRFSQLSSWHYQLQGYQNNRASDVWAQDHIFVIDPEEVKKTPDVLAKINEGIKKSSLKLAYLSIGEAERYRDYFNRMDKGLILFENKNWPGNYKVKFWEEEWQEIILKKLEKIISEGYDGVYLDIVDAFYEIKPHKLRASQMRDFLMRLRDHAQSINHEFLMIQQNAPTLYEYLPQKEREAYFTLVNGISYEDCFFFGSEAHDNNFNPQDYCLKSMKEFSKRGKFILSVEYLKDESLKKRYFEEVKKLKSSVPQIIPLVASRPLDGKR